MRYQDLLRFDQCDKIGKFTILEKFTIW